jgi:hypothetical protein
MGVSRGLWACPGRVQRKFLTELVNMCSHENLPLVVGGDYNIMRHPSEKIMTTIILGGLSYSTLSLMD